MQITKFVSDLKSSCTTSWFALTFLLLLYICSAIPVNAASVFKPEGLDKYSLNSYIDYLDDPDGSFTINEVATTKASSFRPLDKSKPLGYDFKYKVLWLRIALDLSQYKDPYWFLINDYEHIGNFSVFYPTATGFHQSEMDEKLPQEGRQFDVLEYIYKIPVPQISPSYVYIRIEPHSRFLQIKLAWAGITGAIESAHSSQLSYGLFFGGLLVLWFYNFALWVNLRDKAYLYYIYYLGCFTGTFFHIYGFAPFLFSLNPFWEQFFAALGYGAVHGMILFARHFLMLKSTLKWIDKYLTVLQWLLVAGGLAAFMQPVGAPFRYLNVFILFIIPVLMFAGVKRWMQGYMPAKIYSLGWIIFAAALGVLSLRSIGFLPVNVITNNAVMVASVWEAIIFSLALSYRMKLVEQESARAKTAFLGMISHELKTPLQGIISSIDLLSVKMPSDDVVVKRLRASAELLEIQVKDLTDYARLENGQLQFQKLSFNASRLAHKVIDEFRPAAEKKGLELRVDIENNALISSDMFRIQQILNNLISNAIKYTQSGFVEVRLWQQGSPLQLILSVSDSGVGFDIKSNKLIFEPFTQIDQSSTRKHDGIGMGLAVVQKLIVLFHGTIKVESAPGKGSIFTVTLPVEKYGDTPIDDSEDEQLIQEKVILLVDDNQQVRETLKAVVEQIGYSCHTAGSGHSALELAMSNKYAAILLDVNMPDIDGFEVASRIRGAGMHNRFSPIIWISATPPELSSPEQKKLFTHFLEKPVHAKKLDEMLKKIIA